MDDRKQLSEYVTEKGITATTKFVGKPQDGEKWSPFHFRYKVTLTMDGRSIETPWTCNPFSQDDMRKLSAVRGLSLAGEAALAGRREAGNDDLLRIADKARSHKADAADVLGSLISDASNTDAPFEEWAIDYGYDPDSRKAEGIYKACQRVAADLRIWLGSAELERIQADYEW